jgi:hypothetical protein
MPAPKKVFYGWIIVAIATFALSNGGAGMRSNINVGERCRAKVRELLGFLTSSAVTGIRCCTSQASFFTARRSTTDGIRTIL